MKKTLAGDFLIYDKSSNTYRTNPEQLVRDDVEKHYWKHVMQTVLKDWRLYLFDSETENVIDIESEAALVK